MALADKVTQFNSDADIAHEIIHGDATTVVQTEGGPVRSLAKLLADGQAEIDAQTSLRTDLAAVGGAALVGTSDGGTVQEKLDALGGGGVKTVNGTAPDQAGDVTLTTDAIGEGQNRLYFTSARVLAVVLAGLDTSKNAIVGVADTVLSAIGKLQKQISDWIAAKDASSGYPGLTLFKINFKNAANTFTSFLTNAATAARTYTFPDKDGTVAMLSDIPTSTGSMVLLGSATVTTAVATIDFLSLFSAAYDKYVIELEGITSSNNGSLYVFMAKAGAVDTSTSYGTPAADGGSGASGAASLNFGGSVLSSAYGALSATLSVLNANSTTLGKPVCLFGYMGGYSFSRVGVYAAASAASGFRLALSVGNFTAGTIRVFGIKNS